MSALRAGTYNPRYRVNAGLDGKAKAESFDGGPATGSFTVRISREPQLARGTELTPLRITWLGHSTVLVEMDGCRLLTDPVLVQRVLHLRRYSAPRRLRSTRSTRC